MERHERLVFIARVRVHRFKVRGKEYVRYIITIPPEIGLLLDPKKKYKVILSEFENEGD